MSLPISMLICAVWPLIVPSVRCQSQSIVDLSHRLNSQTLHWPEHRDFELKVVVNQTIRKGDLSFWVQADEVYMSTHTGTHLDAPCHFAKGKWSVADIPLQNFVDRPAAVIDVVDKSMATRDYQLNKDDIKEWEEKNGDIPDGAIVLVRTGWSRFWPKKLEYLGTETKDTKLLHFPGVGADAAEYLADKRNIVGIGIDTASLDCGQCDAITGQKSHIILAVKNVYNLENIGQNIHELPATGALITLLPIKIDGASGVPVTVIARLNATPVSGGQRMSANSLVAIVLSLMASITTYRHLIH